MGCERKNSRNALFPYGSSAQELFWIYGFGLFFAFHSLEFFFERCPVKYLRMVLPLVLIVAGCSPVRQQLSSWQGASLDELVEQVGPPSSVSDDMSGNKFYHWQEDRGDVYTYIGRVNLKCERTFGVDGREIITSFDWEGTCLATPDSPWQRMSKFQDGAE